MNTTKLILIGLAVFAWSQLKGPVEAIPFAQAGADIVTQSGGYVSPPKETWSQMTDDQKKMFAVGSILADEANTNRIQTCAQALSGERYAPYATDLIPSGDIVTGMYFRFRDGIFGLDC